MAKKQKPKSSSSEDELAPYVDVHRYRHLQVEEMTKEAVILLGQVGIFSRKEAARVLKIDEKEFDAKWGDLFDMAYDALKVSIRKWQIDKARTGDTQMLIKIGEFYLEDQRDLKNNVTKSELDNGLEALIGK